MGEKETIGARVPTRLRERVDEYAEVQGIDRSTAIVELLRQGLDGVVDRSERPLEARVEAIENDVERLEHDMEMVRQEAATPWWWKF